MTEDELLLRRVRELAERAYARGVYTRTGFLSPHEQALLLPLQKSLPAPCALFGGMEGCERQMAQFGSADVCGYEQPFPIVCVRILPRGAKFADALTHRDFLGALMGLGVVRDVLGDILVRDNAAYLVCEEGIAPFIIDGLTAVKHTAVDRAVAAELPADALPTLLPDAVQAASERADGVIAKAYKLSREQSQTLFRQERVFLNSAVCTQESKALQPDDVVSVRGYGRFIYRGVTGRSKKGKLNIKIDRYAQ